MENENGTGGPRDETEKIWRIVDANANRAREGLRVMEEIARFVWDDRRLTRRLRARRHAVTRLMCALPGTPDVLLDSRESLHDAGKRGTVFGECKRRNTHDLLFANCKRVQEACRVLEETVQIINPSIAGRFKRLRFVLYRDEQLLIRTLWALDGKGG